MGINDELIRLCYQEARHCRDGRGKRYWLDQARDLEEGKTANPQDVLEDLHNRALYASFVLKRAA